MVAKAFRRDFVRDAAAKGLPLAAPLEDRGKQGKEADRQIA